MYVLHVCSHSYMDVKISNPVAVMITLRLKEGFLD